MTHSILINSKTFKRKAISIAILASLGAHQVMAADSDEQIDEIIISGIRHSLQTASELKRNTTGVIDAITAEDVGKFPSANVADSLQRITGVQISRDRGGEGRFVSIRGLGPQFNMTKLNGRTLATDNAGRDFSYDVMPSEAISGAAVYKTSTASLPEGSIGGMINLTTAKPLDRVGFHASGSLSGLYDGKTEETTPKFSGVVSNTFLDDTLGANLGVSYVKRSWRADTYENFADGTENIDLDGDGNRFEGEGRGYFPGIVSYQTKFGERERLGVNGSIQYKPSDTLETTIDAFYSKFKSPENSYSYNINFYSNDGWNRFSNPVYVPWVTAPDQENRFLITSFDLTNIPIELGNDTKFRETETTMLGWNTKWNATESLELIFDIAYSEADRPVNGQEYYTVVGMNGGNYHWESTSKVPRFTCTLPDGRQCYDMTKTDAAIHFMEPKGENVHDEAVSSRFDGIWNYSIGELESKLKFGLAYSTQEKNKEIWKATNGCAYCDGFATKPSTLGFDISVPFPSDKYSPGPDLGGFDHWLAIDPLKLFAAARAAKGDAFFDANIAAKVRPRESSVISEDISVAYIETEINGSNWQLDIGGRLVQTDVTSSGATQELLSLTPIANSTNFTPVFSGVDPVSVDSSYVNFLPSLNASFNVREDTKLRFSMSRSMNRPTISQLGPDVNWEVNSLPVRLTRNGNPSLKPVIADSADLSLEWYGEKGDSAAVALFNKNINGFITRANFNETILNQNFSVSTPLNGDTAQINGIEIAAQKVLDSGWGAQVNYTRVENSAKVTNNGKQVSSKLDGVSKNTYNLMGFYEQGPIMARLTWSFRDAYTSCSICGPKSTSQTTKSFGSLDFSSSYDINETFTIYLEGQNLLEDDTHTYNGDVRSTEYYEAYARRFEVGVRAKF